MNFILLYEVVSINIFFVRLVDCRHISIQNYIIISEIYNEWYYSFVFSMILYRLHAYVSFSCLLPLSVIINSWNNVTFALPNSWPSRFYSLLEKQPSNIRHPISDNIVIRKRNRHCRSLKFIKSIISLTKIKINVAIDYRPK